MQLINEFIKNPFHTSFQLGVSCIFGISDFGFSISDLKDIYSIILLQILKYLLLKDQDP